MQKIFPSLYFYNSIFTRVYLEDAHLGKKKKNIKKMHTWKSKFKYRHRSFPSASVQRLANTHGEMREKSARQIGRTACIIKLRIDGNSDVYDHWHLLFEIIKQSLEIIQIHGSLQLHAAPLGALGFPGPVCPTDKNVFSAHS